MKSSRLMLLAAVLVGLTVCPSAPRAQQAPYPPAATPPAETSGGYVVITAPEADVLADPRAGAAVVLKGYKGDLFPLRGQQGEWFLVGAGETTTGWLRRGTAALLMYPEFLDPVRLRESYTPPPYVPPRAYGYPGWGYGRVPYPWQDPLWWGLWYYDQKHDDDGHHDHHDDHDDHRGRGDHGDRQDRDRGRGGPRPNDSAPPPPRDPRQR